MQALRTFAETAADDHLVKGNKQQQDESSQLYCVSQRHAGAMIGGPAASTTNAELAHGVIPSLYFRKTHMPPVEGAYAEITATAAQ